MTDLRVNFNQKNSIARSLSFGFAKSSSDDKLIDSFKVILTNCDPKHV